MCVCVYTYIYINKIYIYIFFWGGDLNSNQAYYSEIYQCSHLVIHQFQLSS